MVNVLIQQMNIRERKPEYPDEGFVRALLVVCLLPVLDPTLFEAGTKGVKKIHEDPTIWRHLRGLV